MGFNQLHIHASLGSQLDSCSSSSDYAQRAAKFNHKALAITDHGKATGIYEHQVACQKFGIKPILGMEIYVSNELVVMEEEKEKGREILIL